MDEIHPATRQLGIRLVDQTVGPERALSDDAAKSDIPFAHRADIRTSFGTQQFGRQRLIGNFTGQSCLAWQ